MDGTAENRREGTDWSWPPSSGVPYVDGQCFVTEQWAPASTVRRPWVRLGRWTLLYRRAS